MDRVRNIPLTGVKPVEPSSMIGDKLPNKNTPSPNKSNKKEEKVDFRSILEKEIKKQIADGTIKGNFDKLSRFIKSMS